MVMPRRPPEALEERSSTSLEAGHCQFTGPVSVLGLGLGAIALLSSDGTKSSTASTAAAGPSEPLEAPASEQPQPEVAPPAPERSYVPVGRPASLTVYSGQDVILSTDVIKLTDTWIAGKGSVFVLALAMLTYVVLALLDGIRSNQHRDRVIGRCLERAALDIARTQAAHSTPQASFESTATHE